MGGFDVVIVGGGIAGSALGAVLAPKGLSVLVLERQIEYRDRVRGETMLPWGVAEAQRLGLDETLLGAGGGYCGSFVPYDETVDPAVAEAAALPLSMMMPGVPGALNVGHPQASEALNRFAGERGAVVVRGVGDVEVVAGTAPMVRYELDGDLHEVACRIVIGADGRQSSVRRGLGIVLEQIESTMSLGGMLIADSEWPSDVGAIGTEGTRHFLVFPRPDGFVRLYVAKQPNADTAGAGREQAMLDAFRLNCVPGSERLSTARVAGPCAYYRGTDSWIEEPAADGVVLVADAAGWSDPIIGQGLSVAMRDVRLVSDVLVSSDDWSPGAFAPYVQERAERMRRLRVAAYVDTQIRCTFTPAGAARRVAFREHAFTDPLVMGVLLATLVGPEVPAPEVFTDENVQRILALA